MFNEITGDAWDEYKAGAFLCITTNGTFDSSGAIVTGAGIAQQATDRFPGFPFKLGKLIKESGNNCFYLGDRLISFPVKHNWWEKGNFPLIEQSFNQLCQLIEIYHWHKIVLPRPGCGNGKLDWSAVRKDLANAAAYFPSDISNRIHVISNGYIEKQISKGHEWA